MILFLVGFILGFVIGMIITIILVNESWAEELERRPRK